MSMDAAAGRDLYVTSTAIDALRSRIDGELKVTLSFIKDLCDTTNVAPPGFGLLAEQVGFGGTYDSVREWAEGQLGKAEATCDGWSAALTQAQQNWRTAEDKSKVRQV